MSLDQEFMDIMDAAITKASGIDCSLEEFISQLKNWKSSIDMSIEAAEEDLDNQD